MSSEKQKENERKMAQTEKKMEAEEKAQGSIVLSIWEHLASDCTEMRRMSAHSWGWIDWIGLN